MQSPLTTEVLFLIGPIPVTTPVVTTWIVMAALILGSIALTRGLKLKPNRRQAALELLIGAVDAQIVETMRAPAARFRALIGTIFFFILFANWSSMVPGMEPPTAHLETDIALAGIVFFASIYFGIRQQGMGGYLRSFAQPSLIMLPLNIAESFTRSFSMTIRLFGNVMSGVFIIGVVLSLAGLFVPIPLMALDLLTGAIQAYIFAVLSMVYIGSALGGETGQANEKRS
ncbi:MAG TPA: F0F1 ATP synthase subunit A [Devosiaceae bacterium]